MRFTWRGHACYEVETSDGKTILVDPFLDHGKTRAKPADLRPDLILVTHGHDDHVGSVLSFRDAPVVTVVELGGWLEKQGMRKVTGMNVGGSHSPLPGLKVWMAPASHSSGISAAQRPDGSVAYGGSPCGFVIDDGDTRAYVAGDTGLFGDMKTVIRDVLQPHVAILPMGDHYTMGPEHAAIAARWLGVNVAVPYHHGTFPAIQADPKDFARRVGNDAKVATPEPDGGFEVRGGRLAEGKTISR